MPTCTSLPVITTIGQIARRLGEPLHRVEYAIRSRGIRPLGIAGNARVFHEEHVERIAAALRDMDAHRDIERRATPR